MMSRLMPSAAALLWPVSTPRAISARQVEMVWARVWISGTVAPIVAQKVKNASKAARIWWPVVALPVWLGDSLITSRSSSLARHAAPMCRPPSPRSARVHNSLCRAWWESFSLPRTSRFLIAYSWSVARPRRR